MTYPKRASLAVFVTMMAATLAMGCASAAKPLVAKADDWSDYRRSRIAHSLDERLAAAWHYLEAHPDGAFHEEVASFFERAEPLYFDTRKGTIPGLRAYLEALPQGPHAEEARDRLIALEQRERRR